MALQLPNSAIWVYCASAWSGFYSAVDHERLDPFIRRCKRLHYSNDYVPMVAEMLENACKQHYTCEMAVKDGIT